MGTHALVCTFLSQVHSNVPMFHPCQDPAGNWTTRRPCQDPAGNWTTRRPCQDPACNWTTRKPPDDRKETQIVVVWSCFPFIRSGQNHLARHSEREKKTRQTEEEMGRQRQGMDRPGVRQVPEGSGKQGKIGKVGCEIICGAPTTLAVKE